MVLTSIKANSGIGFELAAQLLADSKFHVLLGARSPQKGEEALKDLQSRNLPGAIDLVKIDIGDPESIKSAAAEVEKKFGKLDVLVNNAAIGPPEEKSLADQMSDMFRINATGALLTTYAFEDLLKKSSETPRIINITSGAGSITVRMMKDTPTYKQGLIPYRASKSALNMITACQAVEYEDLGWKVFLYNPGFTVSNLGSENKAEMGAQPVEDAVKPLMPLINGEKDELHGKFYSQGDNEIPW